MKTVRNLVVVVFFLVTYTTMASPVKGVKVLVTSHEIFYFKIDKGWIGGEVVVLDSAAQQVTTQILDKKKILIDFFDFASGTYTIVLKKGDCDCSEKFIYIKE